VTGSPSGLATVAVSGVPFPARTTTGSITDAPTAPSGGVLVITAALTGAAPDEELGTTRDDDEGEDKREPPDGPGIPLLANRASRVAGSAAGAGRAARKAWSPGCSTLTDAPR
jgi:hypothetical protein